MKRTITANWEPVSVEEAKAQIQGLEGISDFDTYIAGLISVAREMAEEYTWRTIVASTYELRLPSFNSEKILLPHPVVAAITTIKYKDTTGTEQTIDAANYTLMDWEEPGIVLPSSGNSWPASRGAEGDITITYSAGYATAALVPGIFKQAIKMMVRTWFDNREDVTHRTVNEMPMGSKYLLDSKRCFRF